MLTPFGKALRKLRIERDLRLVDLAQSMNVTASFLSAVETGRKPIPVNFENAAADALGITAEESLSLQAAADQTRKTVKVNRVSDENRSLVAEFARKVDGLSAEELSQLRDIVFGKLKMAADETPFDRRRRGLLVSARSTESIWEFAGVVRRALKFEHSPRFPIGRVLEFMLPQHFENYSFEVVERCDIDGDEARTIPAEDRIILAADVYGALCDGDGRACFTGAHELGHLLLHRTGSLSRSSEDHPIYRDAEWQADTFAGALLVSPSHAEQFPDAAAIVDACGVTPAAARVMYRKFKEKGLFQK